MVVLTCQSWAHFRGRTTELLVFWRLFTASFWRRFNCINVSLQLGPACVGTHLCLRDTYSVKVWKRVWEWGGGGGEGVCGGVGGATYHRSWRKKRGLDAGEYSRGKENKGRKEKTRIPSAGEAVLRDWRFINTRTRAHTHVEQTQTLLSYGLFSLAGNFSMDDLTPNCSRR